MPTRRNNPEIRYLPAGSLVIDPKVQRELNPAWARTIASEFDDAHLGTFHVSRRTDGTCVLMDGQHRREALLLLGQPHRKVECKVYLGLSLQEEAETFRALNHKLNMRYIDDFFVRVTQREPVATAIVWACKQEGWTASRSPAEGRIAAMKSLEAVYAGNRKFGQEPDTGRVQAVLHLVTRAWGHCREAVDGSILHGLGMAIMRYGNAIDYDSLISKLAKYPVGPAGIIGRARGLRDLHGGTLPNAVAEVIVGVYNQNRRKNVLPAWRS